MCLQRILYKCAKSCRKYVNVFWKRGQEAWQVMKEKTQTFLYFIRRPNQGVICSLPPACAAPCPKPHIEPSPTHIEPSPTHIARPELLIAQPPSIPQRHALKKAQKRGMQRWCRWLTATKSRIGGDKDGLRKRLGEKRWQAFVQYANDHFKSKFVNKFTSPMSCCGPLGAGVPCPNGGFPVDPRVEAEVDANLATLHLDHARDLTAICEAWKKAMPVQPRTWHDGVDKDLVCQLLFGVEDHARAATSPNPDLWKANLAFRCGASKQHRAGSFCHEMWGSHDAQWPITADMLRA